MSEPRNVPEQTREPDPHVDELRAATERAEAAEAKLASLQSASAPPPQSSSADTSLSELDGIRELRNDSMMAHLIDSLEAGKNVGHYGRLVFAMVARHFLSDDEVLSLLTKDPDFSPEQAQLMLRQVEGRDYSPPKRERILEWQSEQEFPILPHPEDPDCGNLYRNLKFPDRVYEHIGQYQEKKAEADS